MNQNDNFLPALAALHYVCRHQQIPFVSYREPMHSAITTLVQWRSFPQMLTNFESFNTLEGYVISPFNADSGLKTYLLQPDFQFKDDNVSTDLISELSACETFKKNSTAEDNHFKTTTKEEFENSVKSGVTAIRNNEFRKVVLSKTCLMENPDGFSAPHFYQKLCAKYPNAYVYFLQMPGVGCWMGATPEPLLTTDSDAMQTVSLAGTQAYTGGAIEDYVWSEKELDEQSIVTNFIAQTLTEAGISDFNKSEVENYRAANLVHLKSGFRFSGAQLKTDFPKLITALHPTPSVGGLPGKQAVDFILKTEKHRRNYYTGFLGTLHPENGCMLYVNLRCMQLLEKSIVLYSGAGITASSVPADEWIETENKLQTLKQVILS